MKPKHQGGYTALHAELCERTLVTLLRGLGPWKQAVYLAGGLVPRYLLARPPDTPSPPPHAGTTDVDLILDLQVLGQVEAYRRLEQNLKALGFIRGTNEEGQAQHFSWRKPVGGEVTVVVDLLCDAPMEEGGQVAELPGERRLSALKIPGAHLAVEDYVEVELTAPLLDERGIATETVRVAGIVPFVVLKALAYEDRFEEKDAYDLVYSLMYYGNGPADIAKAFAQAHGRWPAEPLLTRAVEILRTRFATDGRVPGARKDGPASYARFLADPGRPDLVARHRQDGAAVAELFLRHLDSLRSLPRPEQ
ncbi:MAG: antitoxin [Chloroflexi bacterium]|nr:antitoxin [Chloroflexota bacterium]